MIELLHHIWIVLIPLILTSSLHMVVVKKQYLSVLNIPISASRFGENKTWRGFFFVPLINGVLVFLLVAAMNHQPNNPFFMGYILGLSYVLFELPNSFLKRKVGIKPGGHAGSNQKIFYVLDKTDSALGVTLAYYFMSDISVQMAIVLFVTSSLVHVLISLLLVRLKIKSSF